MQSVHLLTRFLIDKQRTRRFIIRAPPVLETASKQAQSRYVFCSADRKSRWILTDISSPWPLPCALSHSRTVATRHCLCHSFDTTALPSCNAFGRVSIPICLPAMKPALPIHRRMLSSLSSVESAVQHLSARAVSCKWRACAVCAKSRFDTHT